MKETEKESEGGGEAEGATTTKGLGVVSPFMRLSPVDVAEGGNNDLGRSLWR